MTDKYLPSDATSAQQSAAPKAVSLTLSKGITPVPGTSQNTSTSSTNYSAWTAGELVATKTVVGSIVLKPLEWAAHFRKLSMDYMGEPEQIEFMNAARWITALANALPAVDEEKPDGFVVGGDIT